MSCTDKKTEIRGWFMLIRECLTQPGVFWRVLCDGPVEWTTPLFDLQGNQSISGWAELRPIDVPNPPNTGGRLFIDAADGALKISFSSGVVKVIAEP